MVFLILTCTWNNSYIGVWALGVANEVSKTVQIYATDVSSNNFPKSKPPNVHFYIENTASLPSDWSNKFDFVNQRFLCAALRREQWPVVLSEIYRVLKPGGSLQLSELDMLFPKPKGPAMVRLKRMSKGIFNANGLVWDVASQLDKMLVDAGFIEVTLEKKYVPMGDRWGEFGVQGAKFMLSTYKNGMPALKRAGFLSSDEEYLNLLDEVGKEWDTHGMQYVYRVATARKPRASNNRWQRIGSRIRSYL